MNRPVEVSDDQWLPFSSPSSVFLRLFVFSTTGSDMVGVGLGWVGWLLGRSREEEEEV